MKHLSAKEKIDKLELPYPHLRHRRLKRIATRLGRGKIINLDYVDAFLENSETDIELLKL
jgi:hypothetical protein